MHVRKGGGEGERKDTASDYSRVSVSNGNVIILFDHNINHTIF